MLKKVSNEFSFARLLYLFALRLPVCTYFYRGVADQSLARQMFF